MGRTNKTAEIVSKLNEAQQQLTGPGAPFEIAQRQFNGTDFLAYKNAPTTLRDALFEGRAHGAATFITFGEERFTFDDFFASVDRLGHHLVEHYGVSKGDRVAIAMRNYPEWMMAFVAVISVGAVVVPLNSWGRQDELTFAIGDAGAKLVFCDQQRAHAIAPRLEELQCRCIVVRAKEEMQHPLIDTWNSTQLGKAELPQIDIGPADLVVLMYTSGTTGNPKGAISTNFAICQALYNFEVSAYISAMANPEIIENMMGSGYAPSTLLAVPLFHVSGCYSIFLLNLRGGRKTSIMYKWDASEALSIIEKERITIFTGVPTMSLSLLENTHFETTDTSSLYSIGIGGTACPPHLKDLIYNKLPHAYPGTGYGMTETNATGSSCTGAAFRLNPSAAGRLSPIVEFKTVDEAGNTLPEGETGEVYIKSPTNVQQYWNLPEASASTFIDGWVATGDVGHVDAESFVYIVDRIKDMVIRGGENIYPIEVEGILQTHPAISEASVYGIPDDHWGEELAATVAVNLGSQVNTDELKAFLADQLAAYKIPNYITLSDEPLAKNAAGKLLKKVIRQSFLDAK